MAQLSMTNSKTGYALQAGRFSIIQDGNWHYTYLNVKTAAADKSIVNDIRYGAEGQPASIYAENPFWIDEYSISKTARNIEQTVCPQSAGATPKLVSVQNSMLLLILEFVHHQCRLCSA
jgi:hypothetical protein